MNANGPVFSSPCLVDGNGFFFKYWFNDNLWIRCETTCCYKQLCNEKKKLLCPFCWEIRNLLILSLKNYYRFMYTSLRLVK